MTEYWDLFDENRNLLPQKLQRGEEMPKGCYHQIIGVWVIAEDTGSVLVTKRAPNKVICPNKWENTGGSVLSGESTREAALRELAEETGIQATDDELIFIRTFQTETAFIDSFVLILPEETPVQLQAYETTDYRWLKAEELNDFIYSSAFAHPIVPQYEGAKTVLNKYLGGLL